MQEFAAIASELKLSLKRGQKELQKSGGRMQQYVSRKGANSAGKSTNPPSKTTSKTSISKGQGAHRARTVKAAARASTKSAKTAKTPPRTQAVEPAYAAAASELSSLGDALDLTSRGVELLRDIRDEMRLLRRAMEER